MGGLSIWHWAIIMIVLLLLFGRRLPEVGRNLGKGLTEFKKGMRDATEEVTQVDPYPQPQQYSQPPRQASAYMAPPPPEPMPSRLPPRTATAPQVRTTRADLVD